MIYLSYNDYIIMYINVLYIVYIMYFFSAFGGFPDATKGSDSVCPLFPTQCW